MIKERAHWADVLKLIGMVLIFWGHMTPPDNIYLAVFAHHVPLFFFASGLFAGLAPSNNSFGRFVWKKIRSLVFPYIVFTLLTLIIFLISGRITLADMPDALLSALLGIRNQTPAVQLWFFTCLFVVSILFEIIKRIAKNKYIITAVCIVIFIIAITCLGHEPTRDPKWFWNIDSALVYLLYYMIGAFAFPVIDSFRFKKLTCGKRVIFTVCFSITALYTAFMYVFGDIYCALCESILPEFIFEICAVLTALIMIFTAVCFSKLLVKVRLFSYMGEGSLYLCGNEVLLKYLLSLILTPIGVSAFIHANWWASLIYCILLIMLCTFTLNILERLLFGKLFGQKKN